MILWVREILGENLKLNKNLGENPEAREYEGNCFLAENFEQENIWKILMYI